MESGFNDIPVIPIIVVVLIIISVSIYVVRRRRGNPPDGSGE
jgi:hypothetical protein